MLTFAVQTIPQPLSDKVQCYATATNPFTDQVTRVKVELVRNTKAWGPTADVRVPGAILGFSVRVAELSRITAVYGQEC